MDVTTSGPAERPRLSLGDLLAAAWRRKWLTFSITFGLTLLIVGVAAVLPKSYRAEVLLQVDQRAGTRSTEGNMTSLAADLDGGGLSGQADFIRSPALALKIIASQKLLEQPEYVEELGAEEPDAARSSWAAAAKAWLQNVLVPILPEDFAKRVSTRGPYDAEAVTYLREENAVRLFQSRLQVEYDLRGSSLRIKYVSRDPALAASVANAVATAYVDQQMRRKVDLLVSASEWLNNNLDRLRANAVDSENKLTAFLQRHSLGASQEGAFTQQQLRDLHAQLMAALGQQAAADSRLRHAEDAAKARRLQDLPDVLASRTTQALREQEALVNRRVAELVSGGNMRTATDVRAELAEIRRRLGEEQERFLNSLRYEAAVARNRHNTLEAAISSVTAEAGEREKFAVQAAMMEREAAAHRAVFDSALRRKEETQTLNGLQRPDVVIVSEARTPARPYKPNLAFIGILGSLSSLAVGTSAALLLAYRKITVRSLGQGEAALGIVGLGWVPEVKLRRNGSLQDVVVQAPGHLLSECLRSTAVSVKTFYRRDKHAILVTSAVRGEGKTSFAMSYGRTIAAAGQSCLLIDADLRRPAIGARLDGARCGLTEAMSGQATLDQVVQIDAPSGLAYISAGEGNLRSLGALGGTAFAEFLAQVRERYSTVIIDAPPLLAAPDGVLLAQQADLTLLVVRWASTPVRLAEKALSRLRLAGVTSAGFILSQVDVAQLSRADTEHHTLDYHTSAQPTDQRRARLRVVSSAR